MILPSCQWQEGYFYKTEDSYMITTILFDLDGTLLPMDQDLFVKSYLHRMAKKMAFYGYDPDLLTKGVWAGTGAMVQNNGDETNEIVFWRTFEQILGKNARRDEPLFEAFYRDEFQQVKNDCGFDSRAAETIRAVKDSGHQVILATNPLFPAIATYSRIKWAGLSPEDFSLITTYENSSYCKPTLDYYQEILSKLNLHPSECLMVGNDVTEDMIAQDLGMKVFLMTDCLINKACIDISVYPHGSFPELLTYIREL